MQGNQIDKYALIIVTTAILDRTILRCEQDFILKRETGILYTLKTEELPKLEDNLRCRAPLNEEEDYATTRNTWEKWNFTCSRKGEWGWIRLQSSDSLGHVRKENDTCASTAMRFIGQSTFHPITSRSFKTSSWLRHCQVSWLARMRVSALNPIEKIKPNINFSSNQDGHYLSYKSTLSITRIHIQCSMSRRHSEARNQGAIISLPPARHTKALLDKGDPRVFTISHNCIKREFDLMMVQLFIINNCELWYFMDKRLHSQARIFVWCDDKGPINDVLLARALRITRTDWRYLNPAHHYSTSTNATGEE